MLGQLRANICRTSEGSIMGIGVARTAVFGSAIALALAFGASSIPAASAAEAYYAGKTVSVIMGLGPSSGGATVGRLLSKHLEQHIAGNPKLVVKHMPGAALMKAHRFIISKAPKDGTTIYYGPRSPIGELLQLPGINFKYTDFSLLGGIQVPHRLRCGARGGGSHRAVRSTHHSPCDPWPVAGRSAHDGRAPASARRPGRAGRPQSAGDPCPGPGAGR